MHIKRKFWLPIFEIFAASPSFVRQEVTYTSSDWKIINPKNIWSSFKFPNGFKVPNNTMPILTEEGGITCTFCKQYITM